MHSELEEINLAWLGLENSIPVDFLDCKKLKYINLSNNRITGAMPQGDWSQLTRLEIIEL